MTSPGPLTQAAQDYLKTIHRLGGTERMVSPNEIAQTLQVKGSSVTSMLKRLAEAGLITYKPNHGAKLTRIGTREARRVIRRHRLIELFLTRVLGLDWSEVDAEAESLEHVISPRLEEALAAYLGEPLEDPHGHPIPSSSGELHPRSLKRLCDFAVGDQVIIREAQDDDPARLRHWQRLGLVPGTVVRLVAHDDLEDMFELQIGGRQIRISRPPLLGLHGELCQPNQADATCAAAPRPREPAVESLLDD